MEMKTINDSVMQQEARVIAYLRTLADAIENQGGGVYLGKFSAEVEFNFLCDLRHTVTFSVDFMGDKGMEAADKLTKSIKF